MRRLGCPRPGVGDLRIVTLLEAGALEMDVARGPVVAVSDKLADDDPEAGLAARQRASDLESLPRGRQRYLRGPGQVVGVSVVDDSQRDLLCPGWDTAQM